jgi:hypothetical protein
MMETSFDPWIDKVDRAFDFTFTGEYPADWDPIPPNDVSLPIPPTDEPSRITRGTDPIPAENPPVPFPFIAQPKHARRTERPRPITAEARREMTDWIIHHLPHPFLSKEQEDYFIIKYSLTRRQVKTGFSNRRQRIVAPMRSANAKEPQQQIIRQRIALAVAVPFPPLQVSTQ